MKITVTQKSKKWTEFERKEWKLADQEHYGQEINWEKKDFKISVMEGPKTIGNLRLDVRVGIAYIDAVIVTSEYRGKGIGKTLIQEAERIATEQGAHKIYLQTGEKWEAVAVYEKLGYKISSRLPNHYFHLDFVEMTKFLD